MRESAASATTGLPGNTGQAGMELLPLGRLAWARFDVFAASLTLNLLALALPIVILQTYDRIVPNNSRDTLLLLIVGVGAALVLDSILRLGRGHITGWAAARFEHHFGCVLTDHLLSADLVAYERDAPGVHLDRASAVDALRDFYSGQAILILVDLPFAVVFLSLVAYLAGALVLVPLAILVTFAALAWSIGQRLRAALAERNSIDDRRYNFVIEVLTGIHTVKGLAMETQMSRRYESLQESSIGAGFEVNRLSGRAQALGVLFSNLTLVAVAGVGSLSVIAGELTIGGLAACTLLAGRSLQPLLKGLGLWTQFQNVRVAKQRAAEALALAPEAPVTRSKLPPLAGSIHFNNVDFAYRPSGPRVLSGIDLDVETGATIAINGDDGCGKTSLLWLILGLLRPTAGRVMLDGYDLLDFDPASVRDQVAFVPQYGVLFEGTILDNLTGFRGHDAIDPALEAAARLGLDDTVALMPEGYMTRIGDAAADTVPGGVRQRIAVARALARNPRILLFDEATSNLDAAGDIQVRNALAALKGETTLIVVSHRPSFLRLADRIYDLQGERLVPRPAMSPPPAPIARQPA